MYGTIKNYTFEEKVTVEDCLVLAEKEAKRIFKIFGNFPRQPLNKSSVRNFIVEKAANIYVQANFYRLNVVQCDNRAIHYGVPLGTTCKTNFTGGYFNIEKPVKLICDIRKKTQKLNLEWFKC